MTKSILLAVALPLIFVGMLVAKPQLDSSHPKDTSIVRGCLKASTSGFTLKAKNGTTYEVTGDTSDMSKLVWKEVELKGRAGSATDISTGLPEHSGETTTNPTAGAAPIIQVQSATRVADHCGK